MQEYWSIQTSFGMNKNNHGFFPPNITHHADNLIVGVHLSPDPMCHWIPDLNLKKRFGDRVHFIKLPQSATHSFSHTTFSHHSRSKTHSLWSSSHACHVGKAHRLGRVRPYKRRMGDLNYKKPDNNALGSITFLTFDLPR